MQIVIDVPEKMLKTISKGTVGSYYTVYDVVDIIQNGTPLPKGHGNLFDENDFEKRVAIMTESMDLGYGEIMDVIDEIPTIIEADKGE